MEYPQTTPAHAIRRRPLHMAGAAAHTPPWLRVLRLLARPTSQSPRHPGWSGREAQPLDPIPYPPLTPSVKGQEDSRVNESSGDELRRGWRDGPGRRRRDSPTACNERRCRRSRRGTRGGSRSTDSEDPSEPRSNTTHASPAPTHARSRACQTAPRIGQLRPHRLSILQPRIVATPSIVPQIALRIPKGPPRARPRPTRILPLRLTRQTIQRIPRHRVQHMDHPLHVVPRNVHHRVARIRLDFDHTRPRRGAYDRLPLPLRDLRLPQPEPLADRHLVRRLLVLKPTVPWAITPQRLLLRLRRTHGERPRLDPHKRHRCAIRQLGNPSEWSSRLRREPVVPGQGHNQAVHALHTRLVGEQVPAVGVGLLPHLAHLHQHPLHRLAPVEARPLACPSTAARSVVALARK